MKKCLSLFITVITLSLVGCGTNSSPASDKAISCAKEAIEVAESYLTYDIDYDEASERLDELKEDMEYVDELPKDDECYRGDSSIETYLVILSSSISIDNYQSTDETYENIQEAIDKLKELSK